MKGKYLAARHTCHLACSSPGVPMATEQRQKPVLRAIYEESQDAVSKASPSSSSLRYLIVLCQRVLTEKGLDMVVKSEGFRYPCQDPYTLEEVAHRGCPCRIHTPPQSQGKGFGS